MIHEKINLTQLSTKTKLNDFISQLSGENKSNEIIIDDLEVGKKVMALAPEICRFSKFINSEIYGKIKALYPQLFWFSGAINGEQSYVAIEKTLMLDNVGYPSFTIGDLATGKSLFEIAVLTNGEHIFWSFTIYSKDGNINYENQGITNLLLFTFKNGLLQVENFNSSESSLAG